MALSAPAGTPKEIITKINESVQRSSADPAYQAAMRNRGMPVTPSSSEEMDLMIRNETTKWEAVIRNAAIKKAD
jgi:tripartite-type tricarboxylate transporter receptor subunit TctC